MDITFRLPSLKMVIEAVPRYSESSTGGTEGSICRVHFVDEAAMKYPSLGMILSEARSSEMGEMSANLSQQGSADNPDPAQYAEQVTNTLFNLEKQGIIVRSPEPADGSPSPPRWRIAGGPPAIKNFIMNAQIVVGVGNIYACESLFQAGIHPQLATNCLSRAQYIQLGKAFWGTT